MTDEELHSQMKACVKGWAEAGRYMEWERRQRVRTCDTARSLEMLSGLFDSAVWLQRHDSTSGLVEQQRLFAKARR